MYFHLARKAGLELSDAKQDYRHQIIENIIGKLKSFDDLSKEEVNDICKALIGLKKDDKEGEII